MFRLTDSIVIFFLLFLVCKTSISQINESENSIFWKPVEDEAYLQEFAEKIFTKDPVSCLAIYDHVLYAVSNGEVYKLVESKLEKILNAPNEVHRLRVLQDQLWALSTSGVWVYKNTEWQKLDNKPFVDLCVHLGNIYGATKEELFRLENDRFVSATPEGGYLTNDTTYWMEDFSQVIPDPIRIGPIHRIGSYSGTLYILQPGRLALIDDRTFVPDPIDWGSLPSPVTRDMLPLGGCLFITTDRGIAVLRGMAMTTLRGSDGLPFEDTTCLARGFDNDLWIGTTTGAIRKVNNQYHYFGPDHWLPSNYVHDIAVDNTTVYIATNGGIGIIHYEPYTLLKKAQYFERWLEEWGHKRLGFVHLLYWNEPTQEWLREISDNDGGHTAHYLAAMSFKYAVTGDEEARREALDAFQAMIWLEEITPKPGFIARAIWSVHGDKGERSTRGSGGLPAKWYPTDDGLWYWKGDTSSDEVNAHIYSVSIFHDLVAKGKEKERAKEHIARIAHHIIDNGWVLRDMDGKPTRWGRWDPDYLLRPYGMEARGLNGMEAQTYMITAYKLTGEQKFLDGLKQLLEWRYHTYTVRQKLTFPPDVVVPWDDELAFRCYYPLLKYTEDPVLRSIYLRSLERHWEVMRMQHVPFFNFVYGALTGNDCEIDRAVQFLRDYPMDARSHNFRNSHRHDLAPEPGYVPYAGGTRAMSPRETQAEWGSQSSIVYDGGSNGKRVIPPIAWLEAYWMGRYYGFIKAPAVTDPALISVEKCRGLQLGAAPYAGPPRPANLLPSD